MRWAAWLLAVLLWGGVPASWGQTIESVLRPGPLIHGHQKVEHDCDACHVKFDRAAQNGLCTKCHKDVGLDIQERRGWHGRQKPALCRNCHTDHRGLDAKIAEFDRKAFDHRQTDFALRMRHADVDCAKCHRAAQRWREASTECHVCHRADDVHRGGLGSKCADCHNERKWSETLFDHDKKTRFALADKHAKAECEACHASGRYKDTPRTCIGCHKKDDDHKGHFGEKCDACHDAKAWEPATFDHDRDTKYPLRARHRKVECNDCHTNPLYRSKTSQVCFDCHRKDDKHKDTLGHECGACHNERGWKETNRFDHDKSRFPLLGKHEKVECKDCHTDVLYRNTPRDCWSCHRKDDKHQDTLARDCGLCHSERNWKDVARFNHDKSRFLLRGKHVKVECQDCHKDLLYRSTPADCLSCHRKDDKHKGNLGEKCEACHTDTDWKTTQGRFDHQKTEFPLRNAHAAPKVKCADCHRDLGSMRRTDKACDACHRKDDKHEGTLGRDCGKCHTDRDWKVPGFDHSRTRFALTGRHGVAACKDCHATPKYKDAPRDCWSCHRKEDKHKERFGTNCGECHNARAWPLWDFDHGKRTHYPLQGSHEKVACEKCHTRAAPAGKLAAATASDCYSCHRAADVHEGAFGRRCEMCHGVDDWKRVRRALR